jgi:hypothetical protein
MGYIQGEGRNQATLFPVVLDDFVQAPVSLSCCDLEDVFDALSSLPLQQRCADVPTPDTSNARGDRRTLMLVLRLVLLKCCN